MTSWLSKRKKHELLELGAEAGMKPDESLRKDDLIESLDEYFQTNSTRLSSNPSFKPYFDTRRGSRPRESVGAANAVNAVNEATEEAKSVVKRVAKKTTKVKAEAENQASSFLASPGKAIADIASRISSPLTARTPASRRATINSVVPVSPGEITENLERATTKFYARAEDALAVSGIPEGIDWTRSTLSSVVGVQVSILLLEAYALQSANFPWRYLFHLPAIQALRIPSIAINIPDPSTLLRAEFWGPTLLWSATSIVLPLIFAFFFNLTSTRRVTRAHPAQRYPYDPMTYSIAKAVITALVYGYHAPYGWVDTYSARVVDKAIYGGYQGIIAGSAISGIAALWEAAQR